VAGPAWTLQFLRILVTFCEPSIYMKFFTIFIPYFGDLVNHVTVGVTLNWYNQGVINGGEGTPSYQGAPSMVHTVKGWPQTDLGTHKARRPAGEGAGDERSEANKRRVASRQER